MDWNERRTPNARSFVLSVVQLKVFPHFDHTNVPNRFMKGKRQITISVCHGLIIFFYKLSRELCGPNGQLVGKLCFIIINANISVSVWEIEGSMRIW